MHLEYTDERQELRMKMRAQLKAVMTPERIEAVHVWPASGGEQETVERDLGAVGKDKAAGRCTFGASGEPNVDAVLTQCLLDERGGIGINAREQPVIALHQGHL